MGRRSRRIIFFILCVLAGLAAGLTYGWVINPVKYTDSSLQALRIDYKTDLVLMSAELYLDEGDINLALERLEPLGEISLPELLEQVLAFAEEHEYASTDLRLMEDLVFAVNATLSVPE